ncbi:MAG TPA: phage tail protein [Archangium sp.]|uniref:phage tail protein n=1 Tax=Archangium sp. TaxID=1872627 RepID=UPI002E32EAAD|nr:phage tail protein [Archangium sp.]HEX5746535.1 phage tail protein [Archangium sp.]
MADPKQAETPPPQEAGAQPGTLVDPMRAYNFKLDINGVNEGHFTECHGLEVQVNALRYREGGAGAVVRRLAGPVAYGDVTLRYGLTTSRELWNWFMESVNGTPSRKNVSILMTGPDGLTEVFRWNLVDAWPSGWKGAALDALGQMVAIESVTLVFESINRGG